MKIWRIYRILYIIISFYVRGTRVGRTVLANDDDSFHVFSSVRPLSDVHREVLINGCPVSAVCDTGAELNVLPSNCIPN